MSFVDSACLSAEEATEYCTSKHSGKINLLVAEREKLDADVLIVGAGPAGLACALRLSQLFHDNRVSLGLVVGLEYKDPLCGMYSLVASVFGRIEWPPSMCAT